jgi:hypothetical protein
VRFNVWSFGRLLNVVVWSLGGLANLDDLVGLVIWSFGHLVAPGLERPNVQKFDRFVVW